MKLPAIKTLLAAIIVGFAAYSTHAGTYTWDTDATTTNWVADGTTLKWFDSDEDLLAYPVNGSDLDIHAEFYYNGVPKLVNVVGTVDVNDVDVGGANGPYIFTNGIIYFTGTPTAYPEYKGNTGTNDIIASDIELAPDPADNYFYFFARNHYSIYFYGNLSLSVTITNTAIDISGGGGGTLDLAPGSTATVPKINILDGATLKVEGYLKLQNGTGSSYLELTTDQYNAGTNDPSTLLLSTNGVLEIDNATAIKSVVTTATNNLTQNLIFNGGTIKWTNVTSTINDTNINVYVQAGGATVEVTTAGEEAYFLNPVLTDPVSTGGGFTKTGAGILSLDGTNTYTGDTVVAAGLLVVHNTNSLSAGAAVRIAAGASLGLEFTGTNTVSSLYLNGVQQAAGTWGATNSSAQYTSTQFANDSGVILVTQGTPIAPTIQLQIVGNQVELSWLANDTGWTLQAQTNGLAADSWVAVPGSTTTNNIYVPFDAIDTSVFYRLANLP